LDALQFPFGSVQEIISDVPSFPFEANPLLQPVEIDETVRSQKVHAPNIVVIGVGLRCHHRQNIRKWPDGVSWPFGKNLREYSVPEPAVLPHEPISDHAFRRLSECAEEGSKGVGNWRLGDSHPIDHVAHNRTDSWKTKFYNPLRRREISSVGRHDLHQFFSCHLCVPNVGPVRACALLSSAIERPSAGSGPHQALVGPI